MYLQNAYPTLHCSLDQLWVHVMLIVHFVLILIWHGIYLSYAWSWSVILADHSVYTMFILHFLVSSWYNMLHEFIRASIILQTYNHTRQTNIGFSYLVAPTSGMWNPRTYPYFKTKLSIVHAPTLIGKGALWKSLSLISAILGMGNLYLRGKLLETITVQFSIL